MLQIQWWLLARSNDTPDFAAIIGFTFLSFFFLVVLLYYMYHTLCNLLRHCFEYRINSDEMDLINQWPVLVVSFSFVHFVQRRQFNIVHVVRLLACHRKAKGPSTYVAIHLYAYVRHLKVACFSERLMHFRAEPTWCFFEIPQLAGDNRPRGLFCKCVYRNNHIIVEIAGVESCLRANVCLFAWICIRYRSCVASWKPHDSLSMSRGWSHGISNTVMQSLMLRRCL
jgi:hypothetical protein